MNPALVLSIALAATTPAEFASAFPTASVVESPAARRLTHASGFAAADLGATPEAAARAFLARHGGAFGVRQAQTLVARAVPARGQPGAVRFERRIGDRPVFGGDVVVGVDGGNAVVLVNAGDVPPRASGRFRISRKSAIDAATAALANLESDDAPRAVRGWRAAGRTLRPVWRVDFGAARPRGDWRTYVDAETGKVVQRVDLRTEGGRTSPANSRSTELPSRGARLHLHP